MPDFLNLYFLAPLIAFVLIALLTMPTRKIAHKIGLIDHPDARKNHEKAVPPIGGLVIFPLFMIVSVIAGADLKIFWPLYISLIILLVTGALDDRFSLNAWVKFGAHISAAALIVFAGNCQIAYLGNLFGFGTVWAGFMSYPFSIIAVVLLINAINLMDGVDGLAGSMSVVMFSWFIAAAALAGEYNNLLIMCIFVGSVCGFLIFNMRNPWRRKASIFLGDAGSMCLGLTIAWFAIKMARGENYPVEPITVAWMIGLPIFDACGQFYRRVREGKHPFAPDRGHFHHHLLAAGIPVHWVAPVIMGIVVLMGAIGYGGHALGLPQVVLTILWVSALLTHMYLCDQPQRYVRLISRLAGTTPIPGFKGSPSATAL